MNKKGLVVVLGFIFIIIGFASPGVHAVDFLGVYCFNLDGGTGSARLAIVDIGGGFYSLHGTSINSSTTGTASVYGTLSVVGGNLNISTHSSHIDGYGMSMGTTHMVINVSTLTGTFHDIAQDVSNSANFEPINYTSGTVSMAICPD